MAAMFSNRCSFLPVLVCLAFLSLRTHANKDFPALNIIRTQTSPADQTQAVIDLINRLIPARAKEFTVTVNSTIGPTNKDTFKIRTEGGQVYISGTTGVAAAWGFQHYLKYYCGCHVSWGGNQLRTIPHPLPDLPSPGITITSNDRFRYYQNVCTASYSFVWWNWVRWEKEIDWMALNGINLPLAFNGQEAIFQRVYKKMGFTDEDLNQFFTGPAFLAWQRMGNLEAFGGPLSQDWINDQLALQHQIINRMRAFGMTPALPAFAGHVPPATSRLFPNATVSRLGGWSNFNATFSDTYLLDFNDPLFVEIGSKFILEMMGEFGTNHIYSADTFNEMVPKSSEPTYLFNAGKAVYSAMATADPNSVWLMQGWLFLSSFWQDPQIKALLTSVEQGKMLLLDLMSEHQPQYMRTHSYYGQPFIWCMLHNFGGSVEMYGTMPNVNTDVFVGRTFPNSTMVGIGLTPEGINQNDAIYEFMNENAWRTSPRNITQWVAEYSTRRYGGRNNDVQTAWVLLARSLYNYTLDIRYHGRIGIVLRPSLKISKPIWFEPMDVIKAWNSFLMAAPHFVSSDLFRYDLVDVTRESLQLVSIKYYNQIVKAYHKKNLTELRELSTRFLELLNDLEQLLASDSHFLLGHWLESAKSLGHNDQEKTLLEYNARNQITLWGPSGEILDYGSKEWAGVVKSYFLKRWQMFLQDLQTALSSGNRFNQTAYNEKVFTQVEQPFTFARDIYPTKPSGDSIQISASLFQKYGHEVDDRFNEEIKQNNLQTLSGFHVNMMYFNKYGFHVE